MNISKEKLDYFRFTPEMDGQTFEIRFLPNPKDLKNFIYRTRIGTRGMMADQPIHFYISLALVNGELKYFKFGEALNRKINNVIEKAELFQMSKNAGIKAVIKNKQGYVDMNIEKINDNKFILDDGTEETRSKIIDLLTDGVDLKKALYKEFQNMLDRDSSGGLLDFILKDYPDWKSEIRNEKLEKLLT